MLEIDLDFHDEEFGNEIGFRSRIPSSGTTNAIYKPHPIANRSFYFRGETLAEESAAERAVVRFDESMRTFPHARALMDSLIRIEGIATVRTDGIKPDYEQVIFLELAKKTGCESSKEQKLFLRKHFPYSAEATYEASFEAYRCQEAMKLIMQYEPRPDGLTREVLEDVYAACLRGTRRERTAVFRSQSDTEPESTNRHTGVAYLPAPSDKVIPLLDDLIAFCNRGYLSAMVRSSVEHFQLEAIDPVSEAGDRLGRLLALLVWRQSGLIENFLPPFSITPAVQTRKHTELIAPYQTGRAFEKRTAMVALDGWCAHCARAVLRSVKLSEVYRAQIMALNVDWRARLGSIRKGSLLDLLVADLLALPVLTITEVVQNSSKSYASCAEAVEKLVDVGILQPQSNIKRNRLFIATDAVCLANDIEGAILPEKVAAREDFFK